MTNTTPPLAASGHSTHANYQSIPKNIQNEQDQQEIAAFRRPSNSITTRLLARLACVALAFVILVPALLFHSTGRVVHVSSLHLVGPLLGPYLDGEGAKQRIKAVKSLQKLDKVLEGRVIFANSPDFIHASEVWQQGLKPPLAVVEVASEADVQLAVPILSDVYVKRGVPFRIKSGGHSYGGFSSVEKGIVLSLSRLNHLTFNERTGIATVGPAVTIHDMLHDVLLPKGFGGVVGESPGVAMGGFVLGGGYGFLSRKYGLGLDNLIRARVVLRDGSLVVTSSTESPDLFWALRGAGQDMFGVVTEMEYQLYPSQDSQLVVSGRVPLDAKFLTTLGTQYRTTPGEVNFLLLGPVYKDGTTDGLITWFGIDDASLDQGETYMKNNVLSLLSQESASSMSIDRTSWTAMTNDNLEGNYVRAWSGFLMEEHNTEQVWSFMLKKIKSVCDDNPYLLVDIELFGGAIADKKPHDTAFFYRNAVYNVGLVLLVPTDTPHADRIYGDTIHQVDQVWKHVSKKLEGVYTNYIMESLSPHECARAYWGGNLERLEQLKEWYDPDNVFHHPQSVLPSGKSSSS